MDKSSPASPRPPSTRPHHDQESFGPVKTTPFGPANLPSNLTLAACLYVGVRGSQRPSTPAHFKPNQVGGQDHARKRDHVRHQLDKQGVPLRNVPPQPTSDRHGAVAQSLHWLRDLASAAVKRLPALPDPLRASGAEVATPPDDAYDEGTSQGIAILRYDIKGQRQPDESPAAGTRPIRTRCSDSRPIARPMTPPTSWYRSRSTLPTSCRPRACCW